MEQQQPIITVENLVAKYEQAIVLSEVSFTVNPSEIFMIIGGSGCGKTTLLNHMIGLLQPHAGNVIIDNANMTTASDSERCAILRRIGVLYQSGALFNSMDLLHNVMLPLEELTNLPVPAIRHIAHNKLSMVGLGDFALYMPAEISGGMQKRAAIARAMALDPKILFLDEPSAGLDPVTAAELDQLIMNLQQTLGITFVIVSHDLASIYNIAERVILLNQGRILAMGKPEMLKGDPNPLVHRFFTREVRRNNGAE